MCVESAGPPVNGGSNLSCTRPVDLSDALLILFFYGSSTEAELPW